MCKNTYYTKPDSDSERLWTSSWIKMLWAKDKMQKDPDNFN